MKGAGYVLVHTPDMITHYGTTQTSERIVNPESEYLKNIESNLRPYERVRAYYPNQTYIGNVTPLELKEVKGPWQDLECPVDERYGKFGEIMPQDEFYLLIQAVDEFELVFLEKDFVEATKPKLAEDPIITPYILGRIKEGVESERVEEMVASGDAEGLYQGDKIVGAIKRPTLLTLTSPRMSWPRTSSRKRPPYLHCSMPSKTPALIATKLSTRLSVQRKRAVT